MNAAVYARTATHERTIDLAVEGDLAPYFADYLAYQLELCHQYAAEHDYMVVAEYTDAGVDDPEPDPESSLAALVEDAQQGPVGNEALPASFEVILVTTLDRLSVDAAVRNHYLTLLAQAGVRVEAVAENLAG